MGHSTSSWTASTLRGEKLSEPSPMLTRLSIVDLRKLRVTSSVDIDTSCAVRVFRCDPILSHFSPLLLRVMSLTKRHHRCLVLRVPDGDGRVPCASFSLGVVFGRAYPKRIIRGGELIQYVDDSPE